MFELGSCNVTREPFNGHELIYIHDFWKTPDDIASLLACEQSDLYWKLKYEDETERERIIKEGANGKYFEDRRHTIDVGDIKQAHHFISDLINKPHNIFNSSGYGKLMTNIHKLYDNPFNDYSNNWWFPHKDSSSIATCIWYFNKDDEVNGTNLYEQNEHLDWVENDKHFTNENINPWIPKKYFNRIKLLKPTYNSAVIFPGVDFYHGMNIENDRYFKEYRMNSVIFISE